MPIKFALATALAIVVAHDIKTQIQAHKTAKLFLDAYEVYKQTEASNHAQIHYLVHVLEENGVAPSEFDLLALRFHGE